MSGIQEPREIKGEKALDFWMDILEPMTVLTTDPVIEEYRSGKKQGSIANMIIDVAKKHKGEIWQILSAFHGVSVNQVKKITTAKSLKEDVMKISQMEEFKDFFGLPRSENPIQSGSVMENIEENEQ